MAVVIETTIGDFTVDLFVESRPQACKNFLKLCKMKFYNFCLFHSVQPNFLAQTGDPSGTGSGGESIYGLLYGENVRYFEAEMMPKLKHSKPGLLSMVNCGNNMLGSQFFITLGEDLVSLDGTHCVFGEITEGVEVVLKLNEAICDNLHRPYKDIRITHTIILEDPFEDPSGLVAPDMSPEATQERLANGRIAADEEIDETAGMTAAQVEEMKQQREANARATILEIVGDLPDAEMAPPENVLFVCKLNPVTTDDDLEIIFSRFGKVKSCEVIRDKTTGESLQYAFVEFEDQKSCEEAYFKMDNVLIDDRRIHVDFSQSVAKMQWKGKGRGVIYHDNKDQSKDVRSSSHRDREDSKSRSRRDRDYGEKERRRDRGREREDDRQVRERGRDRDGDERHRKRDERDRNKSDWRKRESKHRKDDYRDDEKRYDSKRKDNDSSRRKEDDSKKVSSTTSFSRKADDKRIEDRRSDDKRSDDRRRDKESRDVNNRSISKLVESEKRVVAEKQTLKASAEHFEIKEKDKNSKLSSPVLNISTEESLNEKSINDSKDVSKTSGQTETSPVRNEITLNEERISCATKISNIEENKPEEIIKEIENGDTGDEKFSQNSEKRMEVLKKYGSKKKNLKRKRKMSESRKRKKRRHSSSSESSSESSDSSDSSTSSDSSDHRHGKKKKLIVAKRYYRGGKLVKEVKKKKHTNDTSDSESVSDESSDTDSKRKHRSKKHKKVININKHPKRRNAQSSDDSQSGSSSSVESVKDKRKKRKFTDKRLGKKYKNSTTKNKRQRKEETSSSSDSEGSFQNSISSKSSKKLKTSIKRSKHNVSLETNSSK